MRQVLKKLISPVSFVAERLTKFRFEAKASIFEASTSYFFYNREIVNLIKAFIKKKYYHFCEKIVIKDFHSV